MNTTDRWTRRLRELSDRVLDGMIVMLLGGMVLLGATQILLRNVFSYSLFWGDNLLQLALLWLVMAGAVAAARNGEHLRINILIQLVPHRARPWLYAALHGFTAVICAVLAWQSLRLAIESAAYGDTFFGELPAWTAQAVMPAGFGFLALHYGFRSLICMVHGQNGRAEGSPKQ